jgi:DNA gyrase/topoisomerase IV subunit A
VILDPVQARGTSGAQTNSGSIKLDLNRSVHEHTFIRPEYPNLNVDFEFISNETDAAFREKEEERSRALLQAHYREMEKIEKDKVELEEQKLKLIKEKQAADIARDKELLRLYKREIENNLKVKRPEAPVLPPK